MRILGSALGPIVTLCIALVALPPAAPPARGLSGRELRQLELDLGASLPPSHRAFLRDPHPEFTRGDVDSAPFIRPEKILHRTDALYRTDRLNHSSLPPGCIAIQEEGWGDQQFFHAGYGDRVFTLWSSDGEVTERSPSFETHLRDLLTQRLWRELLELVESEDPPTLVSGLLFGVTWTYYDQRSTTDEDELPAREREGWLASCGRVIAMIDSDNVMFHDSYEEARDSDESRAFRREAIAAYERSLVREACLDDAEVLFHRLLQLDERHRPRNLPAVRTRVLEYLRSRLDPSFVVDPAFADWEIEGLGGDE